MMSPEEQTVGSIERARAAWQAGRLYDAELACHEALRINPDDVEALHLLGRILCRAGRAAMALPFLERAARCRDDSASIHRTLAAAYQAIHRLDAAEVAARRAVTLAPSSWKSHRSLATILVTRRRSTEAIATLRTALALEPASWMLHHDLGVAHALQGSAALAAAEFRAALDLDPNQPETRSALISTLHYLPGSTGASIHAEAVEFGRRLRQEHRLDPCQNEPDPSRPLRLGYVSGDFVNGPVGQFLQPVFDHRSRPDFEIICYSSGQGVDDRTRQLREGADGWRVIFGHSDADVARLVRSDRIDLLIDLSGHVAFNRLGVFAHRPAPVQISWLGYFGTTGLDEMDVFVADSLVLPLSEEPNYTETVVRLPDDFLCFAPHDYVPIGPPPVLQNGFVTFGAFHQMMKMNPEIVGIWATILKGLQGSRIVLKTTGLEDAGACQRIHRMFAEEGISEERVILYGRTPHRDYLAAYNGIDIALDAFPFNGGTTTIDALWMGVPVVSLVGDRFVSRMGLAHLTTAGVAELAVRSIDAYVGTARSLAHDPARLAEYRRTLRPMLLASPLCDAIGYTRALEGIYRRLWAEWCAGTGARNDASRDAS